MPSGGDTSLREVNQPNLRGSLPPPGRNPRKNGMRLSVNQVCVSSSRLAGEAHAGTVLFAEYAAALPARSVVVAVEAIVLVLAHAVGVAGIAPVVAVDGRDLDAVVG